ncbi:hypothetical protein [Chryseobacterium indoltheticum]|uniref:hypothetical protein n=1 Tax=Chryseobacterium indoltheticum TaxID=254 RepID=UPI003F49954D
MNKISLIIVSLVFIISCSKKEEDEKLEFNRILNAVLKYESNRNSFDNSHQFLISPELQKIKTYVPSQKEILGEEPGPPSFFNKNIIRLLNLKENNLKNRKSDSLNLLKQNVYIFDSLNIDTKINLNIKVANKEEIDKRMKLYQFSNPIYFDENSAYIETIYHDSAFGIGLDIYLKNKKDGSWIIKKIVNTFIT